MIDRSAGTLPRIAVTAGEPAGIGPELLARLAASDIAADLVAIADPRVLAAAARAARIRLELQAYDADQRRVLTDEGVPQPDQDGLDLIGTNSFP